MNNSDLISMGFKNLWRRKARTILTILGVIIGTSSIVIMLSLGIAMNENFKHQLEKMGSINVIDVYSEGRYDYSDDDRQKKGEAKLNDDTLAQFEAISGVDAVTPVMEKYVVITAGNLQADMSIIAMDPSKMKDMGIKIAKGRYVNDYDKDAFIFGAKTGENFYDPKSRDPFEDMGENNVDLMNERLKLSLDRGGRDGHSSAIKVEAVGIIQEGSYESDWSAYTSIETLEKMIEKNEKQNRKKNPEDSNERSKKRRKNDKSYESAKVKVSDIDRVEEVKTVIEDMGFRARSLTEMLEQMKKTSAGIQAVLGGIGAVSLFVAALGITNTMIMSIYERTREIGVMKVIGARISDIKRLFLFEAGMIGFTGGVAGILLSYGVSLLINHVGKSFMEGFGAQASISVIPIWLVLSALAFSTFVGIASGYYPARRAMNLSALEAIKNE